MDEEKAALEETARRGDLVNSVIQSRGWLKIIKPGLLDRELTLINEFLGVTTYEEFVRIQQAVNAIRNLLSYIEVTLSEGKAALDELKGVTNP